MSHWKTEAKFVLELQQKDMEAILCETDSEQKEHANFVRKRGFSKYDKLIFSNFMIVLGQLLLFAIRHLLLV